MNKIKNKESMDKILSKCNTIKKVVTAIEMLFIAIIASCFLMIPFMFELASDEEIKPFEIKSSDNISCRYLEDNNIFCQKDDTNIEVTNFYLSLISSFIIMDIIRRILKNTINQKTPFNLQNIKLLKIMSFVSLGYILNSGLTKLLVIASFLGLLILSSIFEYGYQIQNKTIKDR